MAYHHSPKIVTDGLVLCLDAANRKSYPGSGTTWTDLSTPSVNGSFINGTQFSTDNSGVINFDGIDDYVQLSNSTSYKVQFPLTISLFFKVNSTLSSTAVLLRTDNTNINHRGVLIQMNSSAFLNITYGNGTSNTASGRRTYLSATTLSLNQWYNLVVTLPDSLNCISYLNGTLINTPYNSGTATTLVYSTGGGTIGWRNDGAALNYFPGQIANILSYNRALSSTEILQNYNATKSRFGL
jgi:hypothetical protein